MLTVFHLTERQTFCRYRGVHQQSRACARKNPQLRHNPTPTGFAEIVCDDSQYLTRRGVLTTEILRRKENFACVRIFYCGPRRTTGHVDVTAIWRERTGN